MAAAPCLRLITAPLSKLARRVPFPTTVWASTRRTSPPFDSISNSPMPKHAVPLARRPAARVGSCSILAACSCLEDILTGSCRLSLSDSSRYEQWTVDVTLASADILVAQQCNGHRYRSSARPSRKRPAGSRCGNRSIPCNPATDRRTRDGV